MGIEQVTIDKIFCEAIEIETAEEREAYIQRACDGNEALRAQVRNLLEAHFAAGSFLDAPAPELQATVQRESMLERIGQVIGPYKLREKLGEGGMGIVWAAEQKQPLRRKVALKLIKPGMDTSSVVARFEAEREALSLMDHPNIARALDAGTTDQGRPYFVMELIRGIPITEYCDVHKLTIRERMELFTHVCEAVQHAHQKGIIHRDVKPSNVMVTEQDGNPIPKVIDFGVAKALHHPLTDRSIYTGVFQAIGTLAYMSPEQATLSATDIDTRTDVYGLGVLLYELLTGSTPFDRKQLEGAALDEACRIIREQDPLKPSTRLGTLGEKVTVVSQGRRTDPTTLGKAVRGELDWIVMKALEKDRSRRYETASELAADVKRYLKDEHVLASPPSSTYRLGKILRRHRGPLVATSLVLICLVCGIVGTTLGMVRAKSVLARLEEELRTTAMLHAMNGDAKRLQLAVRDARAAGATEGWARSMEALGVMISGDAEKCLTLLKEALALGEDTISVHALLAQAHLHTDDPAGYMREYEILKRSDPRTFEDKLHSAMAMTFLKPSRSFELANEAFEESRSPLALSVLSMARAVLASDTGDAAQVEQAIAEATAAEIMLPECSNVQAIGLFSRAVAFDLAKAANDTQSLAEHRDVGQRLAEKLLESHNVPDLVADFYLEIGESAKAKEVYDHLLTIHDRTSVKESLAHLLLREHAIESAAQVLSGIPEDCFPTGAHCVFAADVEDMRLEVRKRLIGNLSQPLHDDGKVRCLAMLCMSGFVEDATKEARRICAENAEHEPLYREVFLFFAGGSEKKRVVTLAGTSRNALCMVHYLVACRMLGLRDRDAAREELAKCGGMFKHVDREMAKTMLALLKDPSWPRWLSHPTE